MRARITTDEARPRVVAMIEVARGQRVDGHTAERARIALEIAAYLERGGRVQKMPYLPAIAPTPGGSRGRGEVEQQIVETIREVKKAA